MVFKDDFYKSDKTLDILIHAFWAHGIKKKIKFFLCLLSRSVRKIDKKDLGKVLDGLIELH